MTDRPTPPGQAGCACPACHRIFNSPSAFDRHRPGHCRDPHTLGMVILRDHQGHPVWGLTRRADYPARAEAA